MNSQQSSEQNQPNQAENMDKNLSPVGDSLSLENRFPVVGIGASAGGLEAFRQLLSHLPTDTGMAFVLIQHLDPNHKSLLREILARETAMPVVEVLDEMAVERNCVYVIPPNTKMEIEQGLLKLTPREKSRVMVMPVDTFFLSLAIDLGSKAIAVVLSGGDGDGSRGLEAVKEAGGITFAQSEDSAQVSSMPNTAVATGHVDFILLPQEIAVELANISRNPYIASPTPANVEVLGAGETAMPAIFSLLRAATRVNFTQYKYATLKRRILRRMVLYKLENIDDYVTYLRGHSAEVQALYEDMLIHVTSFFRDPIAFETLSTKVFPHIANQGADVPIRIWVAGCSTGEEAYSSAICLLEYLENQPIKPPIQIYATDLSDRAIDTARVGFYKYSAVADVSPERLGRFFVPVDGGYRIGKSIREMCVFARQNLCSDPPFSKLDLISCRNVLIYLGAALQKKILPTFHYGLKPTGFLLLGTSETTGDSSDLFTAVDKKQKIYARKLVPARLTIDRIDPSGDASELVNPTPSDDPAWGDFDLQKEADRIILDRFAPVGVVIDNDLEILHFRGQTSLYLEPAPGRASHNLRKMAKDGLKLELRSAIYDELQRRNHEVTEVSNDLENLISSTNIPILMLGSDLCIRRFTPHAQTILHLIPTDVGRPLWDINHALNVTDLESQIREVINTLKTTEQEVQDRDGHWYDLRIRPYRTLDNKIDGAMVILVDIDALKRSMEQLEHSRNYVRAIVETVREPPIVLDGNLRVFTANRSFYRTFEATTTDTEQRPIFELGNEQWDIPKLRQLLLEILPTDSELQDFEVEHDFEQFGHKTMLLNARKMTPAEGGDNILLAIEDITERKRLESELKYTIIQEQSARSAAESANRAKDEFLSMVSHELRNPLGAILGWAQLLRTQKFDVARTNHALETIEQSARTQARLIEDLLDVSAIASGKLRLNTSSIDLVPIIHTAIDLVQLSADAKQIELVANLDPALEQIVGDPDRIGQIISNLLVNAIKFTPAGGRIDLNLAYLATTAQIGISDTGSGIRADFLPDVFERWSQADPAQNHTNSGLGLGLSIVRSLVELHGGTITVASPGEAQGSTFTVLLPLKNPSEEQS
jgi:PAS domain S-box-containing protein